jgi:regulator of protease activity HflC (stomatin/prohibitin superfamily)
MLGLRRIRVHSYEKGLYFRDREFKRLLDPGVHWFFDPFGKVAVHVADLRDPWLEHDQLDLVVAAGVLEGQATVLDLKDHQRALVWVDGRFARIVGPGLTALWTTQRTVRVEIVETRTLRFDHAEATRIQNSASGRVYLDEVVVPEDHVGVYFRNGTYAETLSAGTYRFWKDAERYDVKPVALAE